MFPFAKEMDTITVPEASMNSYGAFSMVASLDVEQALPFANFTDCRAWE